MEKVAEMNLNLLLSESSKLPRLYHTEAILCLRACVSGSNPCPAMSWNISCIDGTWWAYHHEGGQLLEYDEDDEEFECVKFVPLGLSNAKEAVAEYYRVPDHGEYNEMYTSDGIRVFYDPGDGEWGLAENDIESRGFLDTLKDAHEPHATQVIEAELNKMPSSEDDDGEDNSKDDEEESDEESTDDEEGIEEGNSEESEDDSSADGQEEETRAISCRSILFPTVNGYGD